MATNNETKRITDFRITWAADHEQYYPGHTIMFTEYTHSGRGCGETLREAFEDALDDLAQQDIDVTAIPSDGQEHECPDVAMLADLTTQLKEPEMLDWDIVKAYCPEFGEHLEPCTLCDGHGVFHDDMTGEEDECQRCSNTEHIGEQEVGNPDCAVCAGEWHFYVNVDIKVGVE